LAKVDVNFSLKQDDFSQSFQTKGILKGNTLTFYDENKASHKIMMSDNKIRYQKHGDTDIDFTFELAKTHQGIYKVQGLTMTFEVKTTALVQIAHSITVTYELLQNDQRFNTVHFTIEFPMTEGGL
jgi:uncharacterized beta-barrel protein YwiB (DUF1934 family)